MLVNDAYNANPRSMEAAVVELSARPAPGRRIAVVGDMLDMNFTLNTCLIAADRETADPVPSDKPAERGRP